MKRNYIGLWAVLAVGFVAVALLSAFSPVSIGSWELRDSGMKDRLTASHDASGDPDGSVTVLPTDADSMFHMALEVQPAVIDSTPRTLLFIGDSMLEGLSPRLAAYAKENGHTLYSVIWYSSTSEVWGRSDKLNGYIDRIKPDFVFVSLGANELFVRDIATKRDGYVKKILADIGDLPYLWIGPPNWKPDTGINDLVAANTKPGMFFLSNGMTFERARDGAHPTRSSAVVWMDSVVTWMLANHPQPFVLDRPQANTASPARVFIHQPDEK